MAGAKKKCDWPLGRPRWRRLKPQLVRLELLTDLGPGVVRQLLVARVDFCRNPRHPTE